MRLIFQNLRKTRFSYVSVFAERASGFFRMYDCILFLLCPCCFLLNLDLSSSKILDAYMGFLFHPPVSTTKYNAINTACNNFGRNIVRDVFRTQWNIHDGIFLAKIVKVRLSSSNNNCIFCFIENPLKKMKNAFYFIWKALFVLKIFKILSWLFGHVAKMAWLER